MDARSASWSKVLPAHAEATAAAAAASSSTSDDSACTPPAAASKSSHNASNSNNDAEPPAAVPLRRLSDIAVSWDAAPASSTLRQRLTAAQVASLIGPSATAAAAAAHSPRTKVQRANSFSAVSSTPRAPATPSQRRHSSGLTRARPSTVSTALPPGDGFFDVFGTLGVPMVIAFILSALAMFAQAYVQLQPTAFANWVMNTTAYDEGEFWLLDTTEFGSMVAATVIFVFFGALYLVLVAYMLFFRHLAIEAPVKKLAVPVSPLGKQLKLEGSDALASTIRAGSARESTATEVDGDITVTEIAKGVLLVNLEMLRDVCARLRPCWLRSQPSLPPPSTADTSAAAAERTKARKNLQRARAIYFQFSDIDGIYHAYYSAMYDLPKLAFQTMTLVLYLRKGFPITIVAFYCTMLTVNWLISFYRFQRKTFDSALLVARVFYLFDLFFAVFAPLLILVYSYSHFDFDREAFATKSEAFPPGDFESTARLFADPTQISLVRLGFSHLTLATSSTIGMKVGLLYLSIYKWRKIIRFLIQSHHKNRRQLTMTHSTKQRKQTRHHLVFGVALFLVFGAGVLMYTIGALTSCARNCAALVHCVVVSYRWQFGQSDCPCLVYINRRTDPRTYEEWLHPDDVTASLSEAAKDGTLKSIQIINRALPTLPETLRRCTSLQQLILIYTETEQFPEWTKELKSLEYIHIEGDFTTRGLKYLPLDMFSRMSHLQSLLTGTIPQLPRYPSLAGLTYLKRLTITSGHSLESLPSFDDLTSLRALNLVENYHVHRLPSLAALTQLRSFNVVYRNEMCCNGYLTGECDPLSPMCRPNANEAPVACVSDSLSAADRAVIAHAESQVCVDNGGRDLKDSAPTLASTDIACAGVMYRQCIMRNVTGICYNVRLQVVTCDISGGYEFMRRLQIARGVGDACDPVEEAWLGCSAA